MRSLSSVDDSGNAVTGLGDFWNLETVELDSTVKFIESHVFDRASQLAAAGATDKFREINLTNVENIWYYAFAGCTKLTTINLQSISAVYQYAFSGCTGLTSIDGLEVSSVHSNKRIGGASFEGCTSLSSVNITSVKSIGEMAFKDCTALTMVIGGGRDGLSVSDRAFEGCSSLASADISSAVSIGTSAFKGCTSLDSVDVRSVTSFGTAPFDGCSSLRSAVVSTSFDTDGIATVFSGSSMENCEAYIGGNGYRVLYRSLADAIEAASSSDTITLLRDLDFGDSPVTISKSLRLDLAGHTVRADTGPVIAVNSGTVWIGGDGRVEAGSGYAIYNRGGDLTISSGTFSTSSGYAFGNSFKAQFIVFGDPVASTTFDGGTFVDGDDASTIGVSTVVSEAQGTIRKKPGVSLDPPPRLSPLAWSPVRSDGYQYLVYGSEIEFNVYDSVAFTPGEGLSELSLQRSTSGDFSTGTVTVEHGSTVSFTVVPQEGYGNIKVTGAAYTKTGDVYSVVVDSYTSITLDADKVYTVKVTHSNDVFVDGDKDNTKTYTVPEGEDLSIRLNTVSKTGRMVLHTGYSGLDGTIVMPGESDQTVTFKVDSDGTINVSSQYKVTIAEGIEHGTVTTDKEWVDHSRRYTLTFHPDEGYTLEDFTTRYSTAGEYTTQFEGNSSFDGYSITRMIPDGSITISAATFVPRTYNITVSGTDGAEVTVGGSARYMDSVPFTVEVSDGYVLKDVSVTGAEASTYDTGTEGLYGYRFTMPAQDVTISVSAVALHTVTFSGQDASFGNVTVNGEPVTPVDGKIIVEHGSSVAFTVTPEAGSRILEVTNVSSGPGTDGSCTISYVSADTVVQVHLIPIYYEVTFELDHVHLLSLTLNGVDIDLSRLNGSIRADRDSVLVFTLEAEWGYGNIAVIGAEGSGDGPYTLTVGLGDTVVKASAEQMDYTITCVSEHGTVDVQATAHYGEKVSFTIVDIEQGYRLMGVYVMAGDAYVEDSLNDGTYSFEMPAHDVVITVGYAYGEYALRYLVAGQEVHSEVYHFQDPIEPYTYSQEGKVDLSEWIGLPRDMRMPAYDLDVNADLSSADFIVRITAGEHTYFIYGGERFTYADGTKDIRVGYIDNTVAFTVYGITGYDEGLQVTMDGSDTGLTSGEEYRLAVTEDHAIELSTVPNTCSLVFITGEGATMHVSIDGASFDLAADSEHAEDVLYGKDVTVSVGSVTGYDTPSTILVGGIPYSLVDGACTFRVAASTDVVAGTDRSEYVIDVQEADHTHVAFIDRHSTGYGDPVRFTVQVDDGYSEHLEVYFDGHQVHPDSSGVYLVSMPEHDVVLRTDTRVSEYTVSFVIAEHTYLSLDGGSPYITGDSFTRTYAHGSSLVFEYYADEGYTDAFTINGSPASRGHYDVSVTGPMEVVLYTEPDIHTVVWKDWNGEVLYKDDDARYGSSPVFGGTVPSRNADAEYTYVFDGWSVDGSIVIDPLPTVSGDATYIAVYHEIRNVYTVTWMNYDGTLLYSEDVPFGDIPVYRGETPSKESDAANIWTWTGWTPEVVPVEGDAEYTAVFVPEGSTYVITWVDWDGTILWTAPVAYGDTPAYGGNEPARAGTEGTRYVFDGWTPEISPVATNATYQAVYRTQHSLTLIAGEDTSFSDISGTADTVEGGSTSVLWYDSGITVRFRAAASDGYDVSVTGADGLMADGLYRVDITGPRTVSASAVPISSGRTVLFPDDGSVRDVEVDGEPAVVVDGRLTVPDGSTVTFAVDTDGDVTVDDGSGSTVIEPEDGIYTIVVDSDVTIMIVPVPVPSGPGPYTIIWSDWDGTVLALGLANEGEVPVYRGPAPTRADEEHARYTFAGWSPAVGPAHDNENYRAVYDADIDTFTVTWRNWDGSVLGTDSVAYGVVPVYDGAEPARNGYSFAGWSPAVTAVTGDAVYTATFAPLPAETFTVTIAGDGVTVRNGDAQVRSGAAVPSGTVLTVTMEQRDGYDAVLTASVGTVGSDGSYTVASDVTFTGSYTSSVSPGGDDDGRDDGFPWWILLLLVLILVAAYLVYRRYRNGRD